MTDKRATVLESPAELVAASKALNRWFASQELAPEETLYLCSMYTAVLCGYLYRHDAAMFNRMLEKLILGVTAQAKSSFNDEQKKPGAA